MKRLLLIVFASLSFSSFTFASENWSAASSEVQFNNTSGVIYKGTDVNTDSITPSKGSLSISAQARQIAAAKTLETRPVPKSTQAVFWIYDAWVEFYGDEDRDGYFNHFSVGLDADTEFNEAQVYARLYLGKDEIFREYHVTNTFTIYGDSSNDSFVVESELLTGFTPDDYEVLIELYDEYTDELVAVIDGYNDADLYLLPLESQDYEYLYEEPNVIIVTEHGGSLGWWTLSLFLLVLLRKIRVSR
ncbi:choice-of-anchor H family protein [Paraglaciecola sp. 2405UD69-4]|uniref:choice-of-anchor H family protein n=1 Tax=Paraglaciecola sp. 2405UD69-4 TaxID=3391836 RepID=UPI0039C9651B